MKLKQASGKKGIVYLLLVPAIAFATGGMGEGATYAQQLFYADLFNPAFENGSIRRVSPDGSDLLAVVDTGGGLRSIDIDHSSGKMYWTDVNNFVIRRADLDGANQEDLITSGMEFPSAIVVDSTGGKFYWGDQSANQIWRANLDGSDPELLPINTTVHRGMALDLTNGKLYWTTSDTELKGEIKRSNLDGSNVETVVSSLDSAFKPAAIAIDVAGGFIYWTDFTVDIVRRGTLDGSFVEDLYIPPINHNPRGIALDLKAGLVYWGQDVDIKTSKGNIMRMDLDGSNEDVVLQNTGLVNHVVVSQETPCDTDIAPAGGNDQIDVDDLLLVINNWGPCASSTCPADIAPLGGNHNVNVDDLLAIINTWGPCP